MVALGTPALAGGPVVIIDEPEVVAERPVSSVSPIIPLLLLLAIGVVASSGGSSTNGDSTSSNSNFQ
jgi:hypothetical protein